jgi:hypothetical protein
LFTDPNPYFSVPHNFNAYLTPWPQSQPLPDEFELKAMQSLGLQLLSEVKSLEASCLLQLRQLDKDAKPVMDYLKLQSRKVDLVLQYVLEKETQEGEKHQGLSFGGSGLEILAAAPLTLDSQYKLNLYIRDELISILCFAKVTDCRPDPADDKSWRIELSYSRILDADVEQLVKASLSVQQKLLKRRKHQKETWEE